MNRRDQALKMAQKVLAMKPKVESEVTQQIRDDLYQLVQAELSVQP